MSADGFKLRLQVPAAAVAACEAALQAMGAAVVRDLPEDGAGGPDEVPIEVYFAGRPRQASLMAALTAAGLEPPPLAVEALPALDWVAESQRHLPALRAGRFFLLPRIPRTALLGILRR